jgi:hypothetical protein
MFYQGMKQRGYAHRVNMNVEDVMRRRLSIHHEQMVNLDFLEDVAMKRGVRQFIDMNAKAFPGGGEYEAVDELLEFLKRDDLELDPADFDVLTLGKVDVTRPDRVIKAMEALFPGYAGWAADNPAVARLVGDRIAEMGDIQKTFEHWHKLRKQLDGVFESEEWANFLNNTVAADFASALDSAKGLGAFLKKASEFQIHDKDTLAQLQDVLTLAAKRTTGESPNIKTFFDDQLDEVNKIIKELEELSALDMEDMMDLRLADKLSMMSKLTSRYADGANSLFKGRFESFRRSLGRDVDQMVRAHQKLKAAKGTSAEPILRKIMFAGDEFESVRQRALYETLSELPPDAQVEALRRLATEVNTFEDLALFDKLQKKLGTPGIGVKDFRADVKKGFKRIQVDTTAGKVQLDLDETIADDVLRQLQVPELANDIKPFLQFVTYFNNIFKTNVTRYFPSFTSRNVGSNFMQSIVDAGFAVLNPYNWVRAAKILSGDDADVVFKNGISSQQMRREILSGGLIGDPDEWLEISKLADQEIPTDIPKWVLGKIERKTRSEVVENGARVLAKPLGLPSWFESHARTLHYMVLREQSVPPLEALQRVNQFLFDYSNLSAIEKTYFKQIFPFFTWTRKNVERQLKIMKEKPGAIATQYKLLRGDQEDPAMASLPDYLRGDLPIQLHGKEGKVQFISNIDAPVKNLDVIWAGGIGKTFKEYVNMVTPLIKNPIEFFYGKDTFGQETRGYGRLPSRFGAAAYRNYPKWAKDWLGIKREERNGRFEYFGDRSKIYMLNKAMFMGRWTSEGVRIDEMAELFGEGDIQAGLGVLTKLLTGLSYKEFDMDEAQRRATYNNSKRLRERMVEEGLMREFTTQYYAPGLKNILRNYPALQQERQRNGF